jgi:hypothetical protein
VNRSLIRADAARHGFQLTRVTVDGRLMFTWRQGRQRTWPRFPSEDTALSWFEHELETSDVSASRWCV